MADSIRPRLTNPDLPAQTHRPSPEPRRPKIWNAPSCVRRNARYWHTENRGSADAPDRWRVESRHWVENREPVSREWRYISTQAGALHLYSDKYWERYISTQAGALHLYSDKYWDWKDTSPSQGINYTYQVRAINSDSTKMAGRDRSHRAQAHC